MLGWQAGCMSARLTITCGAAAELGFKVTQIRITDIIANTYYARIHLARPNPSGGPDVDARDVDARPSDAINLAVRFGAPM